MPLSLPRFSLIFTWGTHLGQLQDNLGGVVVDVGGGVATRPKAGLLLKNGVERSWVANRSVDVCVHVKTKPPRGSAPPPGSTTPASWLGTRQLGVAASRHQPPPPPPFQPRKVPPRSAPLVQGPFAPGSQLPAPSVCSGGTGGSPGAATAPKRPPPRRLPSRRLSQPRGFGPSIKLPRPRPRAVAGGQSEASSAAMSSAGSLLIGRLY